MQSIERREKGEGKDREEERGTERAMNAEDQRKRR